MSAMDKRLLLTKKEVFEEIEWQITCLRLNTDLGNISQDEYLNCRHVLETIQKKLIWPHEEKHKWPTIEEYARWATPRTIEERMRLLRGEG